MLLVATVNRSRNLKVRLRSDLPMLGRSTRVECLLLYSGLTDQLWSASGTYISTCQSSILWIGIMKLNFKSAKVAFLDFETQSESELITTRKYARHPSTKALTCCIKVEGQMLKMGPYLKEEDKTILQRIAKEYTLVAHNAPFDAAIWEDVLKLPEAEWFDTLPCARAAGLPGGLNNLSKALGGRGKHKDGERLIQMLCCVKPGKVPAVGPAHSLLMEYNVQDVEELEMVYNRVKDYGEPEVMIVDRIINNRGMKVDRQRLLRLIELSQHNTKVTGENLKDAAPKINANSTKQVHEYLATLSFKLKGTDGKLSLNKFQVQKFLENPEAFYTGDDSNFSEALATVAEFIELRKEASGLAESKLMKAYEVLDDDDFIRDQLVYFGAHTGRWSGRKLQPHNIASNVGHGVDIKNVPLEYDALKKIAEDSKNTDAPVTVSNILAAMVRICIENPNSLVADYGAVELRCLAWLAEDYNILNILSDPHASIYIDMGMKLFKKKLDKVKDFEAYRLAKSIVLGCIYGMSGGRFAALMAIRNVNTKPLDDVGLTAADCVKIFRASYPALGKYWTTCGEAALAAVAGSPRELSRGVQLFMRGEDLHVLLPSGRPIIYRNARIEPIVPGYCKAYNMPEIPVPTVTFDNPKGFRGFLYGSKLAENISQAISRDLLAQALVDCESASLPAFVHVHDEIGSVGEESRFGEFMEILSIGPSWAKEFPILVEGYSGPIWTKQTKGYKEGKMLSGRWV